MDRPLNCKLIRDINTILRNMDSEVRGSRVTEETRPIGIKLREKLMNAQRGTTDNVLLIKAAKAWIHNNHPEEVLRYQPDWICYSMQKWSSDD